MFLEVRRDRIEARAELAKLKGKTVQEETPAPEPEKVPEPKKVANGGWASWGKK